MILEELGLIVRKPFKRRFQCVAVAERPNVILRCTNGSSEEGWEVIFTVMFGTIETDIGIFHLVLVSLTLKKMLGKVQNTEKSH